MALLFGCLLVGALWSARSLFGWVFYAGALTADLWLLYVTRSKTALGIALLLLLLLPPIFYVVRKGRYYMTVTTCLAVAVIGAALLNMMVLNITLDTINQLMFGDLTFTGRSFIWDAVLREVQDRPLTGFGWGAFWGIGLPINPFTHADPNEFFMDATVINTAHSGYMDILLQTGWIGLGLTSFAILWYIALAMRLVHRNAVAGPALVAAMVIATVMLSLALNNALESQLFRAGDWIGFIHLLLALQLDRMALDADRVPLGRV
nr:O-antigen ligase family protein [Azospirillum rugosum]